MGAEQNKAIVRRWFEEVWNRQQSKTIDELLTPDCIVHGLAPEGSGKGPAAFHPFWEKFRGAFPDIRITVEDILAEEDKVAARIVFRGTHEGDHLGPPATGKTVSGTGIIWARLQNGKIAESWNEFDALKIFLATGVVQMAGAPRVDT